MIARALRACVSLALPVLAAAAALVGSPGSAHAQGPVTDATEVVTRLGVYGDNDRTRVNRYLVTATTALPRGFVLGAQVAIDTISSASVDVRAAPDAVTAASPTLTPSLVDQRNQYDLTLAYARRGVTAAVTGTFANEIDYRTFGAALRGSYELAGGNTTLLGGVVFGRDTIGSVIDREFGAHLISVGYTAGVAQVLSRTTVLRARYDGGVLRGFQVSPYRAVRYGNWTALPRPGGDALLFVDATAEEGERVPSLRVRHQVALELLQSLALHVALMPSFSVSTDSWGLTAESASLELRVTRPAGWRFVGGYRFYHQDGASFYRPKYTGDPSDYRYATADKKLGRLFSHSGLVAVGYQILERPRSRVALAVDLRGELLRYQYDNFLLLHAKTGFYSEAGIRLLF